MSNWRCNSKFQIGDVALNAKRKRDMMALNAELRTNDGFEHQTKDVALNAKMKMQGDNEGEICPSVACCYNSQSTGRV